MTGRGGDVGKLLTPETILTKPAALTEHGQLIASEVLAGRFGPATPADTDPALGAHQHAEPDLGLTFWLARA